jgi:hypothetical protein
MDLDLTNAMTPTRGIIGLGCMCGSNAVTKVDEIENLFF